jgi:N-acetylglucosamine-6-phosphate deacetylase
MDYVRPEVQVIRRCQAVLADRVLRDACLRIEHGQIAALGPESPNMLAGANHVIDANGRMIGPGFVDVHCHGDGTRRFVDAPEAVALELLRQGTTTVLATVGYTDMEPDLVAQLHHFDSALGEWGRESVAGFHLEGPYVNRKYGAQTARGLIKDPEPAEYREWLRAHGKRIRWWTCAPEIPGADAFIREASAAGVVVAAGHTEATPDELSSAVRAGLKVATHWSNATGNTRGRGYRGTRIPGVDEAALVFDELSAEVIPDQEGLHVHPLMLRLLLKAKGTDRILIITDAAYRRANDPIGPADAARDVSIDAFGDLAGSRLTMAGAARNFRRFTGCAWPELFRMASLNAARLLGLEAQIGSLEIGKRANLILFEDELQGLRTFLAGREVPLRP